MMRVFDSVGCGCVLECVGILLREVGVGVLLCVRVCVRVWVCVRT